MDSATALEDWLAGRLAAAAGRRQAGGQPLVTLSWAQSLDGCLTHRRGEPLALSGPQALALTHRLRAAHAALLVGIGTVLADDPRLTARLPGAGQPQPVILDSRLRCPPQARLLSHPRPPWIATRPDADPQRAAALTQAGARLLFLPPGPDGRLSLPSLLAALARQGIASLMVEGGSVVLSAFLAQGLAGQAVITIAPRFVAGLPAVQPGALPRPFPRLTAPASAQCGDDLVVWGAIGAAD